jgi:hypothetical protein
MKSRYRAIGNPTKAQQAYQDDARALGCMACRLRKNKYQAGVTEIHHRTIGDCHGQKQLGHSEVVALCSWHHRGVTFPGMTIMGMRDRYGASYAHHKRDFVEWLQDTLGERSTAALQRFQDALLAQKDAA